MMVPTLEHELAPNEANHVPLSPLSFLKRAAQVYPQRDAVVYGARRYSYRQLHERSCALASALERVGVQAGERVAILAPNIPEMLGPTMAYPVPGRCWYASTFAWRHAASPSSCATARPGC